MDRREKKTKEAIYKALSELLKEKNYNQITIQEIIDKANVGRSTFYSHFETKDYLVHDMCEDLLKHVFLKSNEEIEEHDKSLKSDPTNLEAQLKHIYIHINENDLLKQLLRSNSSDLFWSYIEDGIKEFIKDNQYSSTKVPKEFIISHIANSSVHILKWLVNHDLSINDSHLEDYIDSVISPII